MNLSPKYYSLPFVVECKWPHNSYFETIAAFNSREIAVAYADDCRKSHPSDWSYRVLAPAGDEWKVSA